MSIFRYFMIVLATVSMVACQQEGTTSSDAPTANAPSGERGGLYIVHVKSDSLQTGYVALAEELARLEENFTKAQENLAKEGNALQAEVSRLQNKAQQGLLSPNQIQSEQQRIARMEQEILQKREVALGSIQQEQLELQTKFSERVRVILEELREEMGYDYILNQGGGSGVLTSNDEYDITELVLERLNAADTGLAAPADSTATN